MKKQSKKRIAPRLANGDSRVSFGHGLPPAIKEGLQLMAYERHESMSWIMEKLIIETFHMRRPKYIIQAKKEKGARE